MRRNTPGFISRIFTFIMLVGLGLLVTACNNANQAAATTTPIKPVAVNTVGTKPGIAPTVRNSIPIPVTPIPVNVEQLQAGGFSVMLDGAVSGAMNGTAAFFGTNGNSGILTLVSNAPNDGSKTINLVIPDDLKVGSYSISAKAEPGGVGASYSELRDGAAVFNANSGTITIQSINPFTGAFVFKATNAGKELNVNGVFNQVQRKK